MNTPYVICTLQDALAQLDKSKILAWDVETDGFYGPICMSQFYQEGMLDALLVIRPDPMDLMIAMKDFNFIAHNAHYEISTIQRQTGIQWLPKQYEDSFLLARLAFPQYQSYSLDNVYTYVYGVDPYELQGLDKKILQTSKWNVEHHSDAQCRYAATDVYKLIGVWEACEHKAEDISYRLDKKFLNCCLDFQKNGMPISEDLLYKRIEENEIKLEELDIQGINVNSYPQVRKALGITKSDELTLKRLHIEEGNELAGDIVKAKKLLKQISTCKKYLKSVERHKGLFLPSTRSGRAASKDDNLQQIPNALKDCFEAPEGKVLVYGDYAQLELRTICAITQCKAMEDLFRNGVDLHGYTRDFIFGSEEDSYQSMLSMAYSRRQVVTEDERADMRKGAKIEAKRNRTVAKGCNFNFLYFGGVPTFLSILLKQAGVVLSEPKGYRIRKQWRKLWREIFAWQQKGKTDFEAGRLGKTPLGREYMGKMITDHLNIQNQGAGAEVAKLATVYLHEQIPEGSQIDNMIHDAWIVECDDDPAVYEEVARIQAKCMQEAWFEISKAFPIKNLPMPVEIKVGKNWGHIENDDIPNIYDYDLEGMAHYG